MDGGLFPLGGFKALLGECLESGLLLFKEVTVGSTLGGAVLTLAIVLGAPEP